MLVVSAYSSYERQAVTENPYKGVWILLPELSFYQDGEALDAVCCLVEEHWSFGRGEAKKKSPQ